MVGMTIPNEKDSSVSKNLIYKELRRSIILGHCNPGSRLIVKEIADEYQTSITPVRDALQMLSQDGLVTIKPRSGYFVSSLTLKQLRDLLDLRRILELAAIEKAVHRITPEQIEMLRNVHDGYSGEDDSFYDRYTEENRKFHFLIAVASGNMALAEAVGKIHDRLARFMVMQRFGKRQIQMHNQIIEALEEHDLEKARKAMLDEVNPSEEAILDTVLDDGADKWNVIG
jgi:DNA-binding GntR family transcriptional regulator